MKKIMMFVGIAIALCTVLVLVEVGLRNDENDVKSFEKPKNSANIQSNENLTETNEEAYHVDYTEFWTQDANFIIVLGYDKTGKVVWKYETKKALPTENMSTELLYKEDGKTVYINDDYTIKALDYKTGKVIWECPNVSCLNTSSYLDDDTKTLYLYSPVTNNFYAIDSNGKMLKEIKIYEYNGNSWKDLPHQSYGIDLMGGVYDHGLKGIEIQYLTPVEDENEEEQRRILTISLPDYSVSIEKVDSISD